MDLKGSLALLCLTWAACSTPNPGPPEPTPKKLPSILLVTLDTTRADSTGLENDEVETPNLVALAERGLELTQAYTTAPTTLPAHASMLTGLYPSEHGIHENARYLGEDHVLLASRLKEKGYRTAAFVSGFPLAGQFGLSRGFDCYDDELAEAAERSAGETTERALAYLEARAAEPFFLWVHYFDAHDPYSPPDPFRSRYAESPYLGEIAYMDQELGRLVDAFESHVGEGPFKVLVAGDHGEGLGDHGEAQHGNLLYQGVMRVPLVVAGSDVAPGRRSDPVSVRRVFDTVLGWTGEESPYGFVDGEAEAVLGEAMKPYLQYGWHPQVMAVRGNLKVIRSGEIEVYDVEADPAEAVNLAGRVQLSPELQETIRGYRFLPAAEATEGSELSQDEREKLASLGYVDWQGGAVLRDDAPSPKDMTHLFADLDAGSAFFVRREYGRAAAVFERILDEDPGNLMVVLRLAVASSFLGRDDRALKLFERARKIAPDSVDVTHYLGMHYFHLGRWDEAAELFEEALAKMPGRLPALESLARIYEGQGKLYEAVELLDRIVARKKDPSDEWLKLGELRMATAQTDGAIQAFEEARRLAPEGFSHYLELGVCYLANRQFAAARDVLDRVSPTHPGYPMALFKRAQVSVLLEEDDREERIRRAIELADSTTRPLIENERLFAGVRWR